MIVSTRDGRHKSQRTKREKWQDLVKLRNTLDPQEYAMFMRVMEETEAVGKGGEIGFETRGEVIRESSFYHTLTSDHYTGKLVSMKEFIEDDYYMGSVGKSIYPRWKEDLLDLFAPGARYTEGIISGSIGSGKTTFSEMALLKIFYDLTMLTDPQSTFGLMPGSEIVLVCFNRDDKLARDVTYGGVRSKLEQSPYFKEIGCKIASSETYLPSKNIRLMAVSVRSAKALGRNVFGGIIDETDFLEGSSISGKERAISTDEKPFAEQLHSSIVRRMKSRYERNGFLPGKLLMSSSAKNKESFTNRRIGEAANESGVFCRDYALYDVKPPEYFSKTRFWVRVGNERIRHKILTDLEYEAHSEAELERLEEEGCRFLHVPDNFRSDFEKNIEDSIRDIGGCVTVSVSPYIQLRERIYESIDPTLKHPLRAETWTTGSAPPMIWSRLVKQVERRIPGTARRELILEPLRHPEAVRHVHVDLSLGKQDAAGIAIGHVAGMVDVERRGEDDYVKAESAPLIEYDLLLRILAPPNGEIDIGAIRGLVYHFMERGFTVSFASMDNFQSAESLQKYRQQGITAEKISVDTSMEPYDYLKLAIYEGRLSMYNYPIVLKELENLQRNAVKNLVDHLPNGSKDVSDAMAGVAYTLSTRIAGNAPLMAGISHYEEEDKDEWIRQTMSKKGEKAPQPVGDTKSSGQPLIIMG